MREKDSSGIFRIMYLHIVLSEVVHGYGGGVLLSYLCEHITKGPANKGSEGLGGQWVLVKRFVVRCPARDSATSGDGSITKKWAVKGGVLAKGGNRSLSLGVGYVLGDRRNSESRRSEAGGCNYETEELHCN